MWQIRVIPVHSNRCVRPPTTFGGRFHPTVSPAVIPDMKKTPRWLAGALTLIVIAAVAGLARGWFKPTETTVTKLAPGVYFRKTQTKPEFIGCNQGWVIFKDFVLVIDANFPNQAEELIKEIRKTTDKPIRYVFDTHYHGDHADGNVIFEKYGAIPIASENSKTLFETKGIAGFRASQKTKPEEYGKLKYRKPSLYFPKKMVIDDGTQRVELIYFGHAHTAGDAVAWLPKHGILFTGDACVNGAFNYTGDSRTSSWIGVLTEIQKLPVKTIAPGHGEISDKRLLATQKRYFVELRQYVQQGIDAGKSLDAIKKNIDFPFYKKWTGVDVKENTENIEHKFDAPRVADVAAEVAAQLSSLNLGSKIQSGDTVAITAGSRGIANIAEIIKAAVDHFKSLGAVPFIVPAMGSHGGGTAEGQREIIEGYGITEEYTGAEIRSSMETVVVDKTPHGIPVHFDKNAYEADHVLVAGRVKPHTGFVGEIESGLHKMMLIGLGKHEGAKIYHRAIQDFSWLEIVTAVAETVLAKCDVIAGLAILENAYDETGQIAAVAPGDFLKREKELLVTAKEWMPRLPFKLIDLLIVDEIGKNISGSGMDTNVIGRKFRDHAATDLDSVRCKRIFVRGLTPETHGNSCGLGMAEFTNQRTIDSVDLKITRINAVTGGHPTAAALPAATETDREAIESALSTVSLAAPSRPEIILAAAVPKGDRFRWMVEKLAELGVSRLIPLLTARSVVKPGDGKLEKMRQTAIAAAKQSAAPYLLAIESPQNWSELIETWGPSSACYVAHPGGGPIESSSLETHTYQPVILAIGPEGGFTDDEIDAAVERGWGKPIFAGLAVAVLGYSVTVLAYVASSPDVRIRCLMVDKAPSGQSPNGVIIQATPGIKVKGTQPEPGDRLLKVGRTDVHSFLNFTRRVSALRGEPIPPGGQVDDGTDPSELTNLPALVEYPNGDRWVEIEFIPKGSDVRTTSSVLVQSLPIGEVVLSFVWFVLQLGVFAFGALAFWNRPYDRSSRMFFLASLITMGAYLGGFHWWIVASSLWLNITFTLCAVLVPALTLHFFLVFPRPKQFLSRHPVAVLLAVYAVPACAFVSGPAMQILTHQLAFGENAAGETPRVLQLLDAFRTGIYSYIVVASVYFMLSLGALRHSLPHARNPMERGQLRWIWAAGLVSVVFVGYTLYVALFDRQAFALGAGRLPMFFASLAFMLAYSVGILRYRLMVVDQIAGKGVMYYVVSCCLTLVFSLMVALCSLVPELLNIALSQQQALTIMVVLMLGVILLLWTRDVFQQMIDRQFFREKYQLDKALQRMNRAVGQLVDPEALAEMMLGSCCDVLDVNRASLYLRTSPNGPFQLLASLGSDHFPLQIPPDDAFIDVMKQGGSFQRVTPGSRNELSPVQNILRATKADLAHTLEAESQIVGLVFLGKKNHGTAFTAEDLTFLNALGQITNVALHSAKVDRDLAHLNEELQKKVVTISNQKRQIALLQTEFTSSQNSSESAASSAEPREFSRGGIQGNSPAIREVLDTVRKVAGSDSTVLLRGESGTGKEMLAQTLHENSLRREGPMIRVHCASLSPSLLESELFGHVKGAFTGADRDRVGRFELANHGTLLLDEIGDISLETQIKLLRVLQERCFEPVGSTRTVHVDVRLVTATHQDLEKLIAQGRFREDLYYRLNVISITLPPLRERKEDIFKLALHFLNRSAVRAGKRISYIDDDALAALEEYSWPGNIRELQNAIERAVVLADDNRIALHDLPVGIAKGTARLPRHSVSPDPAKRKPLPEFDEPIVDEPSPVLEEATDRAGLGSSDREREEAAEREILMRALRDCDGNKARAARQRLPRWLKRPLPQPGMQFTDSVISDLQLETVCESAKCPNRTECWSQQTATFMILGNVCTRPCGFCSVPKGRTETVQADEPERVAEAAARLGLRHVVITSVTRDDLPDGGADHFYQCVLAVRERTGAAVEVLTPDFLGNTAAIDRVIEARPDVFNHNTETVPRLYHRVRRNARYDRTLNLLQQVKDAAPDMPTKSGLMLGLGETLDEILDVCADLRSVGCEMITIGQYLQPTPDHLPVERYVPPEEFDEIGTLVRKMGFEMVASGPFVRSSYHAGEMADELAK
eukprot:g21926.t1